MKNSELELGKEYFEKNEEALTDRLIGVMKQLIDKRKLSNPTPRIVHAKGIAAVRAEFTVHPLHDERFNHGIFANPKTYQAWVRFSNQASTIKNDKKIDIRALAIKLMGVKGEKLWQSDPGAETMDLVSMTAPVFLTPTLKKFLELEQSLLKGGIAAVWFFLTNIRTSLVILRNYKRCANVLEASYFSATAYLLGNQAIKWKLEPVRDALTPFPRRPNKDFLSHQLQEDLLAEPAEFRFLIQFQSDPVKTPIENAMVRWKEIDAPYHEVARLKIFPQNFGSPAQMEFMDNLAFHPWRTLPEQRPLGVSNRTRLKVYDELSSYRHRKNQVPLAEPTPELTFPNIPYHISTSVSSYSGASQTASYWKNLYIGKYAIGIPTFTWFYEMILKKWLIILITLLAGYFAYNLYFPVHPNAVEISDVMYLNNKEWTEDEKQDYYHLSQGSRIMPYKWFLALEYLATDKMFNSPEIMNRYRIFPDPNPTKNKHRLPVGFAITKPDPVDNQEYVGITCAACHTGQLNYKGMGLRIDGGAGMMQFDNFLIELVKSTAFTLSPIRQKKFRRFAARVLDDEDIDEDKIDQLKKDLFKFVDEQLIGQLDILRSDKNHNQKPSPGGFGRIDALGSGGNALYRIFSEKNLRTLNAPVTIPPIWHTHEYGWVQLNGSIRQPLSRNIIEALAVNARIDVPGSNGYRGPEDLFRTNIDMQKMYRLEEYFKKLKPPKWPEKILGKLDSNKIALGYKLFKNNCASCHSKKYETIEDYYPEDKKYYKDSSWYKLTFVPYSELGTDSTDAYNFRTRTLDASLLWPDSTGPVSGASVISYVIEGAIKREFDRMELSDSARWEIQGRRGFGGWRAPEGYFARPLSGIWATPPFLHNNSVPSLFELLLPADKRTKSFYTGGLEFDPINVGYVNKKIRGSNELDTTKPGNSNAGHEYGMQLSAQEKYAIIEYLKQLTFDQEDYEDYFPYE